MSGPTDSFRNVTRYTGQDYRYVPTYIRQRDPISPINASPDIKPKEQQGYYPISSLWTTSTNQNVYVLAGIVNNLANWVLITAGGAGPLLMLTGDDGVPVSPTLGGVINLNGRVVANATHAKAIFTESPSANTENIDVQVSAAIVATDITRVGLAAFNNAQFTVDANGFVSLIGGGAAIDQIAVDASTPPGTNPVLPSLTGQIVVTGAQVAAGVVGTNVIRTDSLAANTYTIEIQRSQAVATSTVADNGVSHFDSARFSVDSNGFVSSTAPITTNLGISQSAGTTFNVTSASGAALSSTNAANVSLQSLSNPGRILNFTVTANQSFTQAGLGNSLFGLTSGVNETEDIPFFLYAVSNAANGENTIAFMISRVPHRTISPVAGNIGQSGNTLSSTQGSFFSLRTITAADYASSPCLCLGSFRMRYSSSLWTIQTINNGDGIGEYNDSTQFTFPRGHFGAATGKIFANNGGTAPDQTTGAMTYFIKKDGSVVSQLAFDSTDVAGAGAVNTQLALPLVSAVGATALTGFMILGAAPTAPYALIASLQNGSSLTAIIYTTGTGDGILQNAAIATTTAIVLQVAYQSNIG